MRDWHRCSTTIGSTRLVRSSLTKNQVRALVAGLRDIVSTLADADPEDRAELYRELGVNLTYSPDGRVNVQVLPRGVNVRVGGGLERSLHSWPPAASNGRQRP